MKPKVIVVDKNDKIIGYKERKDVDPKKDIVRNSGIFLENEKGEILLAQRSFDKKFDAGKWGPSAAGTVDEGETYEINVIKEVLEEIGIHIDKHELNHIKTFYIEGENNFFGALYHTRINSDTKFVLEDKVNEVRWFSIEEVKKEIVENLEKFTSKFDAEFQIFLNWQKENHKKVILVDRNDQIVGYKERKDRNSDDIIRISSVWIENENGEILVAQRSKNEKHNPNKWGPATAGTLERGDSYESCIIREIYEEIGVSIDINSITDIGSFYRKALNQYFAGTFYAKIDSSTQFTLQEEEVEDIKWISWADLEKDILVNPEKYLLSLEQGIMRRIIDWKKENQK